MISFVPGPDGKPCIWPIPEDCLWNGERFAIKGRLNIWGDEIFLHEAEMLAESLNSICPAGAGSGGRDSCIKLLRTESPELGDEGYILDVTEREAVIKANTGNGAFYGCQSLLQLILNSPDTTIHGARIIDRPANAIREAEAILPQRKDAARFRRFVDFLANYKYNRVMLAAWNPDTDLGTDEIKDLLSYMEDRYIRVFTRPGVKIDRGSGHADNVINSKVDQAGTDTFACDCSVNYAEDLERNLFKLIKTSNELWRPDHGTDKPAAVNTYPEYMRKVALQLYPMERSRIEGILYPSAVSRKFRTLDIRAFYNAPLYRLSWYPDDYDFTYLDKAGILDNSVPFSILQGVNDQKLGNGFVLAGNGWNSGVLGIPVKFGARSLSFLHSYIINKTGIKKIGDYIIHYNDGTSEKIEIKYGRDIIHWNADLTGDMTAYKASPSISGVTFYGVTFALYSFEWVNPKPQIPLDRIDVITEDGCEDGGIALFGITAGI